MAEFSVSPITPAQGLSWENVAGSVSFWGDCQVQTSPREGLGFLVWGSLPNSTKASCFMPKAPELESDPKYTLNAPPHWAEVMQTEGRAAFPHLLGVTSSGDSAAGPLLKCQVSTGQEGTHRADQSLLQPEQMLHPASAGTF